MTGVQIACDKMGGQEPLAKQLDVTQQAVSLWVKHGYVPWERVRAVAQLTGMEPKELCDPRLVDLLQG